MSYQETQQLLYLIEKEDFTEIKKLVLINDDNIYSTVVMFYFMLKNVSQDIAEDVFRGEHNIFELLRNFDEYIEEQLELFLQSDDTKDMNEEDVRDVFYRYMLKEPTLYISILLDLCIENEDEHIKDLIKENFTTPSEIYILLENTSMLATTIKHESNSVSNNLMYSYTQKNNKRKTLNLIDLISDVVTTITDNFVEHMLDIYIENKDQKYDYLNEVKAISSSMDYKHLVIFLRKKYAFNNIQKSLKGHYINSYYMEVLYRLLVKSQQIELFEEFMEIYSDYVISNNLIASIYKEILRCKNTDTRKQFKDILVRYEQPYNTEESKQELIDDILTLMREEYVDNITGAKELKSLRYSITQEDYDSFGKDILHVYSIKDLKENKVEGVYEQTLIYSDLIAIYNLNKKDYTNDIKGFYKDLEQLTGVDYSRYKIEEDVVGSVLNQDILNVISSYT